MNEVGYNPNKKRRRTKQLVKDIKEQMDFYFSDANLNRDKFMRDMVGQNGNNYVRLDVLLTFNQLRHMGTDVNLLRKAILLSDQLHLSDDLKSVRRKANSIKPLPSDIDHCTVVIDHLPPNASIQWLKAVCTKFGTVGYISLPRYKSDAIKGFAFVEFTKLENAVLACSVLNSPPRNFFPKLQQFTSHIKNKLSLQFTNKTFSIKSPNAEEVILKAKRRQLHNCKEEPLPPLSDINNDCEKTELRKLCCTNNQHCKCAACSKCFNSQTKSNKINETTGIETSTALSYSEVQTENDLVIPSPTVKSKITCINNHKNKRKADVPMVSYHNDDGSSNKKARFSEESLLIASQDVEGSKYISTHKRKRRNRKCREKSKKGKTNKETKKKISLHVMMKTEWNEFKKAYMREQRENFGKLKSILQKCSSPDPETTSVYIKHHLALKKSAAESFLDMSDPETDELENHIEEFPKSKTSTSVFIPGVVASLSSLTMDMQSGLLTPLPHFKVIKSYFEQYGSVAYVDVKPGSVNGYIRFETSDVAQRAIMEEKRYGLCLLTSVQEERYWDHLLISRQLKRSRERERQRGKQRLVFRAEKRTDNASTRHIKFNFNFH